MVLLFFSLKFSDNILNIRSTECLSPCHFPFFQKTWNPQTMYLDKFPRFAGGHLPRIGGHNNVYVDGVWSILVTSSTHFSLVGHTKWYINLLNPKLLFVSLNRKWIKVIISYNKFIFDIFIYFLEYSKASIYD